MKQVKSMVLMSILSVMMVLCLSGCGKSAVVGNWSLAGGESEGVKIDTAALKESLGLELDMSFEFKQDGTFTGVFMGESSEGTWQEAEGKITATIDGESIECSIVENQLHMDMDGSTLIFEKK